MLTQEKVSLIVNLGRDMSSAKDLDILLDRLLADARRFTNAEAGSIYVKTGGSLSFAYTQNDVLQRRLAPGKKLVYSTFTLPIDQKSIAGYAALTGRIENMPDVRRLPPTAPYSFNPEFDEATDYRTQSMLTVALVAQDAEVVGVLQLINARDASGRVVPFAAEDEPFIRSFAGSAAVAIERAKMTRSMIMRMVEMARLRDPLETGMHVKRVADYSLLVYERWAARRGAAAKDVERDLDALKIAAMLHDVGKVAVSDAILKKPAKLTPEEFDEMKKHTWLGAGLFDDGHSPYDRAAASIALHHHERWDGFGYPGHVRGDGTPLPGFAAPGGGARGRKGEEIPPFARVVAVADVFDALSCARCYKDPWPEERVLETLRAGAGSHFDPEMIDAFFFDLDAVRAVRARYPEPEAETERVRR